MSTEAEYDRLINNKWKAYTHTVPTDEQAIRGCRAIYRKAMRRPWKGKVEIVRRKNQYTWIRNGVMYVNPNRPQWFHKAGWHDMTHTLSHYCHQRLRPYDKPHSERQTILETELTNYVLSDAFAKYR
tara:strand:- start:295 stop:675 length:381 start_codon:yes stop_codon:yes gene_type:complete